MVSIISVESSRVLRFSFSKYTATFFSLSFLTQEMQSTVFLANRLMDFVMTMSTFPFRHWSISWLKSSLRKVLVALRPSSAKTPANIQLGFCMMCLV